MLKRFICSLVLLLASNNLYAVIDLTSVTGWSTVLQGATLDYGNDQQAAASIDLLGNATYPMFYMEFDDLGDAVDSNDEVAFSFRADKVVDNQGDYKGYLWIGLDFDNDGKIDAFMVLNGDGTANGQTLTVYDSDGSSANNSPSTTSLLTTTATAVTTGFSFYHAFATDISDIDADGDNDYILSYKVNLVALATALNGQTLSQSGLSFSTLNGGTGVDKDTPFKIVVSSAQQVNSLNGDLGGYQKSDDQTVTYTVQGAFTPTISYSDTDPLDATLTTITAAPASVAADGSATATITVQSKDSAGVNLTTSAGTLVLSTTGSASLGSVTDNLDGTYTASITNTVEEVVTVSGTIAGTAITDTADVTFTDITPPAVSIINVPASVNASAFNVTVEFNEDVTGFVSNDVTVTNSSVTNFTIVDANTYTVEITPDSTGNITIDVATSVAQDGAGNNNTAATQASVVFDNTAPTVDIQGEPGIVNAISAFNVTVEFSEDVTGFVSGDVIVTNGTVTNFTPVDGNTYTVDITPSGAGNILIDVAANVAQDTAGNNNTAAVQATTFYDIVSPGVDIQGEPVAVNSTAAFIVTVQFTEDVSGFISSDVTVANGSVTNFTVVDGNTYTVEITPSGAGNVTIDVAANVAQDGAGNNNTAATQAVITFDNIAPTVDIQGEPTSVNSTAAFNVTVEFSEDVIGFISGDVTAGNGSVTGFTAVDGNTYTVEITPSGAGNVTIDVAANVAQDGAANNNTAATQASVAFDNTAPTVDIQGEPASVNSTAAFNVTVEFSEDVSGFIAGDVTVVNASVTGFTVVDGNTYTVEITPSGTGNISIDVTANVAQDVATNNNIAATQASIIFDNTAPVVSITSSTIANASNVASYPVSGNCSIGDGDVTVSIAGATPVSQIVSCTGAGTWAATFDASPISDGSNALTINAGQTDSASNTGNATQLQLAKDTVIAAPFVNPLITNSATPTISGTAEANSSMVISVAGATYNTTANGSGAWSIDTVSPDSGTFSPNLNGSNSVLAISNDAAGNSASDIGVNELTIDTTDPVVTINAASIANVSNSAGYTVSGNCTTGDGDVAVAIATATPASQSVNCSGTGAWSAIFNVTAISDGSNVISITAGQTDSAGNFGSAGPSTTDKDGVSPAVDVLGEPTAVNSTSAFTVTVEFSEDVTGFVAGDVTVGNGSVTGFTPVDGNTYTVQVTPSGAGNVSIDIAANTVLDGAGNNNTAATQAAVAFDNTQPTVDIQGEPASVNTAAAFNVTVEFSEDVSGFVSGDVTAGNASITDFTVVDGNTYTVQITPNGAGNITIDVAANVAQDGVGNNNTAAIPASITFDNIVPTVDIQGEPAIVNSTAAFNVTIEFSEDVSGFVAGDVTVGNGSVTAFTPVDGNTYTVQITPSGAGNVSIDVAANVAQDVAGNNNTAATTATITFDSSIPTVSILGGPVIVNSNAAFNVTAEFSEDVTGFVAGDVTVGNGSVTGFAAVDGNTYTVQVTPNGAGDITIDVAAGVAQDASTNDNTASLQAVITYDSTQPMVDIQGEPVSVNSVAAFNVTIEFSEDVTGFVSGDVTVGNGSVTAFTAVDGNTYIVQVTPGGAGNVSIDVAANVAQDAASNNNTAAIQALTTFDNTAPAVDIQGEPVIVNSTAAFNVTIAFSEDVSGFVAGDIVVGNGSVTGFTPVDGNTYTVQITPGGVGNVSIDVAANVAQDTAANNNTAATQASVVFDNTVPVVVISSLAVANAANENVYSVSGSCTAGDGDVTVVIAGAAPASQSVSCSGAGAWSASFDVSAITNGSNAISVTASQTDAASNAGSAGPSVANKDSSIPTVDIQGEPVAVNSVAVFNVTVEFSEDVTGFVAGDVTVGSGTVTGFTVVDSNTYTVEITPGGSGNISVDVAANVAQDGVGNNNAAATQVIITFDDIAPTVDIQGEPASVNSVAAFNVTVEFSEDVTGFVVGDVTVGNGSVTGFTPVDGNTYTVEITPGGSGNVSVDVAANVAQDGAGNNNTAASQAVIAFDNTVPTVDIQGEPAIVNSTAAFNITVEFSENVTGFVAGDVSVANGSVTAFTPVDGNTYTVDVTPSGTGNVSIDVAANVAQDAATNNNTAAAQANVVFDSTVPTVDIQGEPVSVNSVAAFNVTVEFSEDVTGFVVGDVTVANGSVTTFTPVDGNTYTVEITPSGAGNVSIDVAANVAQDGAGNNNTAATQAAIAFDNTVPTVDIQGEPAIVNSTAAFNITIEFSEEVTGFVVGDVTVANGSVTAFTPVDGNTYTVEITPSGTGNVSIDVAANVAQDAAANNNTAAAQVNVIFDNTAPDVSIISVPVVNAANDNVYLVSGSCTSGDGDVTVAIAGATPASQSASCSGVGAWSASFDVSAISDGSNAISVTASQTDAASNTANVGPSTANKDTSIPTVDIQGEPASVNTLNAFNVTFEFSEDVTGFVAGDVTVANGSVTAFTPVDGNTYTVEITPSGSGNITLDLAANAAQDAAGNNNTAAAQASTLFDNTPPSVAITSAPAANQANQSAYPVSGTCTSLDGNVSVVITAPPLAPISSSVNCTAGGTWSTSFNVAAISDGFNIINIGASQTDSANNQGHAIGVQVDKDVVQPTVQIQNVPATLNSAAAFNVTVEFSEDVSSFVAGDVSVGNGSVTGFTAVDGNTYTVEITPSGVGNISIDVAANVAQDSAANNNTAAAQANIAYDDTAPTVDILGEPTFVINNTPFNVTVEFSEDVSGFIAGDVSVANGSVTGFTAVDGNTYTVEITPSGTGDISIDVAANVAQDSAANNNTAATTASSTFDNTAPTVDVVGEPVIVNSNAPFNVTLEFSEDVSGFIASDVSVGNGSVTGFTAVDGNTYTVEITPSGAGEITIDVAANVAQDAAGNNNTAATTATTSFDDVAPGVDIQGEPVFVNSIAAFNVTVEFTEDVSGFVAGDVSVGNGSVTGFTAVDGNTYTVEITPSGAGNISIDIAAGVAQDSATNGNTAAATAASITFDNIAPVVTITDAAIVNAATASSYTIGGDCTTGDGDVAVTIVGASPINQNVSCVAGSWSATFDVSSIADGINALTIDASQTDAAANTGNAVSVQVDKDVLIAVPTVNLLLTNSSTPVITGAADADTAITIVVAGATYSTTATTGGLWSLDTAVATPDTGTLNLVEGGNEVVVTSVDAAGNSATDTSNNEITLTLDDDNDGIPNAVECPSGPPYDSSCTDTDGDGTPDFQEVDSDNDGIPDASEAGLNGNNPIDSDNDGIPDYRDTDSDNDGIDDSVEGLVDSDGDGIPDYVDIGSTGDSDGDGIPDSVECPAYPACPDTDGDFTPDYLETDADNDGIDDAVEAGLYPSAPLDTDDDGVPDYQDTDSDEDGFDDSVEGVVDVDNDGIPDYVDAVTTGPGAGDSDGDGIADDIECELYPLCADSDNDGTPDYMETDSDDDGITDMVETGSANNDADNDGIDDALDVDITGGLDLDNDGIDDTLPLDTDGDGTPDYQDIDSDGDGFADDDVTEGVADTDADGIPNYLDADSANVATTPDGSGDSDNDGISDTDECLTGVPCVDVDQDGLPDYMDSDVSNGPVADSDNDGLPNYLDPDDDNDNIPDVVEDPDFDADNNPATNPLDSDLDGIPDYLDTDSDNDGISDAAESGASGNDHDNDDIDDSYDTDLTGGVDVNNDGIDDVVILLDSDNDNLPDYIDAVFDGDRSAVDTDNDGIPDEVECPVFPTDCADSDNDGTPDYLETDSDGDGIDDSDETGSLESGIMLDTDGDGIPDYQDTDSDNDGVDDAIEGMLTDSDADGIPDAVDADSIGSAYGGDSDADGVEDAAECHSYPVCADMDNDGTPDYMDADNRPYDPEASIDTGLNGVGGNGPWTLLLITMAFMLRRKTTQNN